MKSGAFLLILAVLAGCTRPFTQPPAEPPPAPEAPSERLIVTNEGRIIAEEDPFSRRALRRADHDLQATTIARGVSLVVEPASDAPIYVSNQLAAALVRRFSGHMPVEAAMAAPVVFLIRPEIAADAATIDGKLVVDWQVMTERGTPVGAVYAARRLTGVIRDKNPWTAFSAEDAEFIAIQTAANLLETGVIKDALTRGTVQADVALTPTPPPRPISIVAPGSQPAPRFAPPPKSRPKS